jgi:uncharacterized protein (DUF779 family)
MSLLKQTLFNLENLEIFFQRIAQNFLIDIDIVNKIEAFADVIVEIDPGCGTISERNCNFGAKFVSCSNLHLIHVNAANFLVAAKYYRIVSHLQLPIFNFIDLDGSSFGISRFATRRKFIHATRNCTEILCLNHAIGNLSALDCHSTGI